MLEDYITEINQNKYFKTFRAPLTLSALLAILLDIGLPYTYLAHHDHKMSAYALSAYFERLQYPSWNWYAGLGQPGHGQNIARLPLYVALSLLEALGLGPTAAQRVLVTLLFVATGLAMYYLVLRFTDKNRGAAFIAGVFYCVNPFAIAEPFHDFYFVFIFAYLFMPIFLLTYLRILDNPTPKSYAVFVIAVFAGYPIATNPAYIAVAFFPVVIYYLYSIATNTSIFKRYTLHSFGYLGVFLAASAAWLIPVILMYTSGAAATIGQTTFRPDPSSNYAQYSTIVNNFRLMNWPWFYRILSGEPQHQFFHTVTSVGLTDTLYYIPTLLVFSLAALIPSEETERRRMFLYPVVLFTISIPLIGGPAEPFFEFYSILTRTIPLYGEITNDIYIKYGFHLAFALSLGLGCFAATAQRHLRNRGYNREQYALLGVMILIVASFALPFYLGQLGHPHSTDIPDHYTETAEYLDEHTSTHGRYVQFPLSSPPLERYESGYVGGPPLLFLSNQPSIHYSYTYSDANYKSVDELYTAARTGDPLQFKRVLAKYNVEYLVVNGELNNQAPNTLSRESLFPSPDFTAVHTSGPLTVYAVDHSTLLQPDPVVRHYDSSDFSLKKGSQTPGKITASTTGNQTIWYGPYQALPAGNYTATYELNVNMSGDGDGKPVEIDAVSNLGKTVHASQPVGQTDGWQNVTLSFQLTNRTEKVEFRGFQNNRAGSVALRGVRVTETVREAAFQSNRTSSVERVSVPNDGARVESVQQVSPIKYRVQVAADRPHSVVFEEGFSPLWSLETDAGRSIPASQNGVYNEFTVNETEEYTAIIRYQGRTWALTGIALSGLTMVAVLAYVFVLRLRGK